MTTQLQPPQKKRKRWSAARRAAENAMTPEQRAARYAHLHDPERGPRMIAAMNAARLKKLREDPEYRARWSARASAAGRGRPHKYTMTQLAYETRLINLSRITPEQRRENGRRSAQFIAPETRRRIGEGLRGKLHEVHGGLTIDQRAARRFPDLSIVEARELYRLRRLKLKMPRRVVIRARQPRAARPRINLNAWWLARGEVL